MKNTRLSPSTNNYPNDFYFLILGHAKNRGPAETIKIRDPMIRYVHPEFEIKKVIAFIFRA